MILRVVQRSGGISRPATQRAAQYARLKLAGLDDAPCHIAVFADRETTQGQGLGRYTMSEMIEYSAVAAVHTLWLAARAEGIGMGWVSILDPRTITAILDVPANWKLIGYFCLGFPEAEDDVPVLQRLRWEERRPAASFLLRR
jgi:5,6-dimethylbenzimidazole synthase